MSEHSASVHWSRNGQIFSDNRYRRAHLWTFDGGAQIPGSSSPHSVRLPYSDPAAVDPEEAFVAAISSCHMLWFLSFAVQNSFIVDDYRDDAVGILAKDSRGKMAITKIALRPAIAFSGENIPSASEIESLHHQAHQACFLANSVRCEIVIDPPVAVRSIE